MQTPTEKQKFLTSFKESLEQGTFVKLTLGKYRGDDQIEKIYVIPVDLKDGRWLQFKTRYKTRDFFENLNNDFSLTHVEELLGKDFYFAALYTIKLDLTIEYSKKGIPKLHSHKPSVPELPITSHNREKARFIDPSESFLQLLGITNQHGQIRKDRYDKYRQIDKFIETIASLIKESNFKEKTINVVDFGSGKSYLTFALYHYLTKTLGFACKVTGIEARPELVTFSKSVAQQCAYQGLNFISGNISQTKIDSVDMVVALHACDTASDDAILAGIAAKAKIIVLAPCCQHFVRKEFKLPATLLPVFKHGILAQRLASELTDGLRALFLESKGYQTKIFEFISSEHTDKNIMISAVKLSTIKDKQAQISYQNIKKEFGISSFPLDLN